MKISVYLAGNVKKFGHNIEDSSWRKGFKEKLKVDGAEVKFLDPELRPHSIQDNYSIFAQDVFLVANCDFVVVYAKEKTGIGAGVEMLVAKMKGVPVISVVPEKSYYRAPDRNAIKNFPEEQINKWMHPFISCLSDVVVENIDEAAKWIREHLDKRKKIKNHEVVDEAIEYYKRMHYENDERAKEAFE